MIRLIAMAIFALILTGCDFVRDVSEKMASTLPPYKRPTLVFFPDYKFAVDGDLVSVIGMDMCPPSLFGYSAYAGKMACILIEPDTTQVKVWVRRPSRIGAELWTVTQTAEHVRIFTADGAIVTAGR